MLLTTLAMLAAAQAPEVTPRLASPTKECRNALVQAAGSREARARRLDELPPGQAMLAVNKMVDGCPVAVLVRRDAEGERVEVPIGPIGASKVPARPPSEPQRRLERDR